MLEIKILFDEHKIILRMICFLKEKKENLNRYLIEKIVDFFQMYVDRCHHGKEENIFFKKLEKKKLKIQDRRILNELLEEHKKARKLVKNLSLEKDKKEIVTMIDEIILLYTKHIKKENDHFFMPALFYLNDEEKIQILREFEEFDREMIHKKYTQVIEELYEKKSND
jgi:hemerythrin-like domain-containing protein